MRSSRCCTSFREVDACWSSEMDNRPTYSACCDILFVCCGILLDVVTHATAHNHENERGRMVLAPKERRLVNCRSSSTG